MRSSILSLVVLFGASAALAHPSFLARAPTAACVDGCTAIGTVLANCGNDVPCLCNKANSKALLACANCSIEGSTKPDDVAQLKNSVLQYSQACKAGGVSVGSLTVTATPIATTAATTSVAALSTSSVALTSSASAVASTSSVSAAASTSRASTSAAIASSVAAASTIAASVSASASASAASGSAASAGYKNIGSGAMGVVGSVIVAAFVGIM